MRTHKYEADMAKEETRSCIEHQQIRKEVKDNGNGEVLQCLALKALQNSLLDARYVES